MQKKILLTSFDTWLSEQQSNSSDDLLLGLAKMACLPHDLIFLDRLPVDVQLASSLVIAKIKELQPDYVICCGMAASRSKLSIEVFACIVSGQSTDISSLDCAESFWQTTLQTTVNVEQLVAGTTVEISYDCGKFVCESLYYLVLEYLKQYQLPIPCIFVHVPILNQENLIEMIAEFVLIINKLTHT
ncbi:hypothetical protein [Anabaena sp. PCC 7108]|uniref:pyroglutamyl-peptidase I family protein n=1 Tax=Anabaena sp. PCC 7108 TaxID=163908 RepID=UPI0003461EA1|nr:hypothetical protein [Anabaena sp. PCC 7108]